MRAYERLMEYVKIPTPSDEKSTSHPSSLCQFDLARRLEKELKELGAVDVHMDEHCYVYAKIPASAGCENCTKIGFIAHMDTVSDFADHAPVPVLHPEYNGEDLQLGESGRILKTSVFPHLPGLKGRTLITGDGTTILGVDDKAGIAEIMTVVEELRKGGIPHGQISIGFTPDEEVGQGADLFDVKGFDADYAYTVDGGAEGEIEYENFNASEARVKITGFNVHPGSAKNTMVNAVEVACEIQSLLPEEENPRYTDGYEGFYHLTELKGDVASAEMSYIIRDHDAEKFSAKEAYFKETAEKMNAKYGAGTVEVEIIEEYRNMAEKIRPCMHLIENAVKAAEKVGIEPKTLPIRGGTDGARLSYMGLPCPNLGTGGYAFHGPYEHITVEGMDLTVKLLLELIQCYSERV